MKMLAPENQAESTSHIIKEGTKGAIADHLFTDAYGPIKNQQNNNTESGSIKGIKGCLPQAGASVVFDDIYSSTLKPDKYTGKPNAIDDAYDTGKPIKKPMDGGIKDKLRSTTEAGGKVLDK